MTTLHEAKDVHGAFRAAQRTNVCVGGQAISAAAIAREMQNHEAGSPLEAWQAAARALVVRQLLLDEGRRLGLEPDPRDDGEGRRETEEEALIRAVVETQVLPPLPDESACRRYYERNQARFRSADLFEASHILLAAHPDDRNARDAAREKAQALLSVLQQHPESFGLLAAEHSACPSRLGGGSLGQIKRGDTVPEFDRVLGELVPCEIAAEPLETRYGFHVVRLERRIEGRKLPFEMVADRIAAYLRERSARIATAQYLAVLASRAGVEGVALPSLHDVGAME